MCFRTPRLHLLDDTVPGLHDDGQVEVGVVPGHLGQEEPGTAGLLALGVPDEPVYPGAAKPLLSRPYANRLTEVAPG